MLALAAGALAVAPAHAASARSAAITFAYDQPRFTGTTAVWSWNLSNGGPDNADDVTITHTLSAGQRIIAVSAPCTSAGGTATCRLGRVRPGERGSGTITASVAPGPVRADGQLNWFESRVTGAQRRATVDPRSITTDTAATWADTSR